MIKPSNERNTMIPPGSSATFYWQLAIFLAGFLLVVGLSNLYSRMADELTEQSAMERARLFIGEEIVDSLQNIEKGVYQLVATNGIPSQQRISRILQARITKLEHDIHVLQHGGTVKRISPLNMEGRNEVVRTIHFRPQSSSAGYVMEVIELEPYLDTMRTTITTLVSMLEQREVYRKQQKTSEHFSADKEIGLYMKSVPPLFFRINENANRLFLESNIKLQKLEVQKAVEREKYRLFANIAIFLVILSVMVSGFLFFRQVATSNRALRTAFDDMSAARDEAEQASRTKSQFLANMSHEIRTPMNAVLGLTELLLQTDLNEKQRHYAQTISRSGSSLLLLLNDILDLSRIEAGKLILEQADFDLRQSVDDIANLFRETARAKGISLALDIDAATPQVVRGDQLRLRQALVNLVGNAIKFTDHGQVTLQTESIPGNTESQEHSFLVRFAIKDTGIGIDEENCSLIFKSFTQADESTTRKYGGTGLGLSVSRQLIDLMGGTLEVESSPGAGSIFFFTLPFRIPESPVPVKETTALLAPTSGLPGADTPEEAPRPRVLVAEDNRVNLAIATEMLEILGYRVDTATDGAQALSAALNHSYNLILMDCQMPELDGYDATRRLRTAEADRGAKRTPVVALTGNAMKGDRELCLMAGMDDYLAKPFTMTKLLEICNKWIAG